VENMLLPWPASILSRTAHTMSAYLKKFHMNSCNWCALIIPFRAGLKSPNWVRR
jgi:hypothetical protein